MSFLYYDFLLNPNFEQINSMQPNFLSQGPEKAKKKSLEIAYGMKQFIMYHDLTFRLYGKMKDERSVDLGIGRALETVQSVPAVPS